MVANKVGVIGAGAWGTALAQMAAVAGMRSGAPVVLWMRDAAGAAAINASHRNEAKLPGVALSPAIRATADARELSGCGILLVAVPAQTVRGVLTEVGRHIPSGVRLVMTAKGLERGSDAFMTDVMAAVCPSAEPLVLSGPSFADDVVRGLPTAVTLAARSLEIAEQVASAISVPTFRFYLSDDIVGVQVGGAVKNVLAIACGIVAGRRLGDSARAALIARAFAELGRLGRAFGAKPETLGGLSGLGDLILTCSSEQSRNYRLGLALGQGRTVAEALSSQRGTSEGAFTAQVVAELSARLGIEVPIIAAVDEIVDGRASVEAVIARLLQRPTRAEF